MHGIESGAFADLVTDDPEVEGIVANDVFANAADETIVLAGRVERHGEELGQVIIRWDPKNPPKPGQTVTVGVNPDVVHLFDAATGKRIN